MARQNWRSANLLNPLPVVLISCADEEGRANVMTAAWCGTICSDPVMVSVSIRKNRFSHDIIKRTGEFVVNLTNEDLVAYTDYVGIYSGRKVDKFNLPGSLKVNKAEPSVVKAPGILESPLFLECKVKDIIELGSHDMFIGEVVSTSVDEKYIDKNGKLHLNDAHLITYSHGEYRTVGKKLGSFGYTSKKPEKKKRRKESNKQK